jgi:acyl-coenzyme A thioesterase PaaI-like protein
VSGTSAALTPPADAIAPVRHPDAPAPGELIGAHYEHCFGCGEGQAHGLHLAARAGEGVGVTAEFTVREAHQGAPGLAHGGAVAAAFDEALGALQVFFGEPAVTASLQTEFRRPVPVDSVLHLQCRVDAREGRKLWVSGVARLDGPDGPVAAKASALFVFVPREHFSEHGRPEDVAAAGTVWPTMQDVNP